MSEEHKTLAITSPEHGTELAKPSARAVVESSQVAGFTIGPLLGREVKRPVTGLALLIMEQLPPVEESPRALVQEQTLLPRGSLVVEPANNTRDALQLAALRGMGNIRAKVGSFLARNGHAGVDESDPQIERLMREAIAEAAELYGKPGQVARIQREELISRAQNEFRDIVDPAILNRINQATDTDTQGTGFLGRLQSNNGSPKRA